MSQPRPDLPQLQGQVHTTRLHFLSVELDVGNTMLDVAASSRDAEVTRRRCGRAQEAHDEVERQLARGEELGLTPPEREALAAGLARLRERLAAVPGLAP